MRTEMAARYPGRCYRCGGKFPAGTRITWAVNEYPAHVACPAAPPPPPAKACRICGATSDVIIASRGWACLTHYDSLSG